MSDTEPQQDGRASSSGAGVTAVPPVRCPQVNTGTSLLPWA